MANKRIDLLNKPFLTVGPNADIILFLRMSSDLMFVHIFMNKSGIFTSGPIACHSFGRMFSQFVIIKFSVSYKIG